MRRFTDKTAATLPATKPNWKPGHCGLRQTFAGASLDVRAMSPSANAVRSDTLSLTLEPGKVRR